MKKVIIVLMALVLAAGFAFAGNETDNLILKASSAEIAPVFGVFYTGADGTATATNQTTGQAVGTVVIAQDITEENVNAYFVLKQVNSANSKEYSKYGDKAGTTVTLAVSCGEFIYTADTAIKSALPEVKDATKGADATVGSGQSQVTVLTNADATKSNNTATFELTYYGRKVANQNVGTFNVQWAKEENLPQGNYTSTITLSYTTR